MSLNSIITQVFAGFLPMIVISMFHWRDYSVFLFFFATAASFLFLSLFMWRDRTKRSLDLTKSMISAGDRFSAK